MSKQKNLSKAGIWIGNFIQCPHCRLPIDIPPPPRSQGQKGPLKGAVTISSKAYWDHKLNAMAPGDTLDLPIAHTLFANWAIKRHIRANPGAVWSYADRDRPGDQKGPLTRVK